jgi:hypothetical protein
VKLLWRKAARVFRAKGHSNFSAADALEEKFGRNQGLGRSRLALLVTTQHEPCPEPVADFILNQLEVKDPESWAEYLREVANEPAETSDTAPAVVAEPREVRDVAREAAGEVAGAVTGRLDKTDGMLEALRGKLDAFVTQAEWRFHEVEKQLSGVFSALGNTLDAFASSVRGQLEESSSTINLKLDRGQAQLNDAEMQFELMRYALAAMEERRKKDKKEILRATWGAGGLAVLGSVLFVHCHVPRAGPESLNGRTREGVTERAASGGQPMPHVDDSPGIGGELGERKVTLVPKTSLPGQAVAPCRDWMTTLYGSCWVELANKTAPCPPDTYQDGQRCYVPVMAHGKPPVGGSSESK